MLKLNDSSAAYFKKLVEGQTVSEITEAIKKDIHSKKDVFNFTPDDIKNNISYEIKELSRALDLFGKMKPVKHEKYAINQWGYEQTNLNNLTVVGTVRGSVIILASYKVFSVSKAKYNQKAPYTSLDDVISTSWGKPYTSNSLAANAMKNAYNGY